MASVSESWQIPDQCLPNLPWGFGHGLFLFAPFHQIFWWLSLSNKLNKIGIWSVRDCKWQLIHISVTDTIKCRFMYCRYMHISRIRGITATINILVTSRCLYLYGIKQYLTQSLFQMFKWYVNLMVTDPIFLNNISVGLETTLIVSSVVGPNIR